jgi:sec-independent protein translocase protein TatB
VFDIQLGEFLVLVVVAAVVIGPERLPRYAQQLATWVRQMRTFARQATQTARAELGPEFDDVDWSKLDPRQYDPRRIVRDALSEVIDPDDPLGLSDPPAAARSASPTSGPSRDRDPDRHPRESARDARDGDDPRPDSPVAFDPDAT